MEDYIIMIDQNGQPYIEHSWADVWKKKAHKYLLKIGEGAKARYFYTQAEIDAYYRKVRGNTEQKVNKYKSKVKESNKRVKEKIKEKIDDRTGKTARYNVATSRSNYKKVSASLHKQLKEREELQKKEKEALKDYKKAHQDYLDAKKDYDKAKSSKKYRQKELDKKLDNVNELDKNWRVAGDYYSKVLNDANNAELQLAFTVMARLAYEDDYKRNVDEYNKSAAGIIDAYKNVELRSFKDQYGMVIQFAADKQAIEDNQKRIEELQKKK